jgi:secreted trypsin-like serine protease
MCVAAALLAALAVAGPASAIVGGRPATRPYPAMGALRVDGDFTCGATLVAPMWVLTAAHCLAGRAAAGVGVTLGTTSLSGGAGADTIPAADVVVHERYGAPQANSNDVALVRLARPSAQPPLRIVPPAERSAWAPGRRATIIGWGATGILGLGAGDSDTLRETTVPVVDDATCASSYRSTLGFEPGTMLCAGELLGMRDTCQGDSGGPLMVPDATGALALAGVASFGLGCGYPTQYGVYARAAGDALYGWIAPRIAAPGAPAAVTPSAPPPAARLAVGRVTRRGTRVTVRVRTTAPVRRLRATLVRVRAGRSAALARATRARMTRGAVLRLRLRRAAAARGGALRVQLTAVDGQGRRIAASRRVRLG